MSGRGTSLRVRGALALLASRSLLPFLTLLAALISRTAAAGEAEPGGAYDRSLNLVRSVLAGRPGDTRILIVLADVHFRRGKFREALAAYKDVSRLDPRSIDPLMAMAEAYSKLEDNEHAEELYRKCAASDVAWISAWARRSLADVHYRRGKYAEAAAELRGAVQVGGGDPETRFLLGRALEAEARAAHASGSPEAARLDSEAAAELEGAIAVNPRHAQAQYVLASVHRRQGRGELAARDMEAFRAARQLTPALDPAVAAESEALFEARTAVDLARILLQSEDAKAAPGLIERALKLQPDLVEAQSLRAWLLWKQGRPDDAARIYDAILAKEPDNAGALRNLAKLHAAAGRVAECTRLLLRGTKSPRSSADAWELLTILAEEQGIEADRAEEFARNALRARPSAANHARLAFALHASGKEAECRKVLEEGIQRFPGDPDLAQALEAVGQAAAPRK